MKFYLLILALSLISTAGCSSEEKSSANDERIAEIILKKGGKFTINGLREIKNLGQLPDTKFEISGMDFNGTDINDDDLEEVAGAKNIKYLGLHSTSVTDRSMLTIKNFTNLRELEISYTDISNDSIDTLIQLTKLKKIFISGTNITEHGHVRLRDELPDCKQINFQQKKKKNSTQKE
jgi:Leucine-rich repeat (LRR) protein